MQSIPPEGSILAGKYRVERVLGKGGMGVVVAAMHLQLGRRVALKFLRAEACENRDVVERFIREARAAVQIHTEHVARVIDVGELENGSPYMVMEYLAGADLAEVLRTRGGLPVVEAVDYVLQASEAIAEAHALGIVHRDLKPANLFLTQRADRSPLVKVLDFGISKALQGSPLAASTSMTGTLVTMGSPVYMSPEQVRSAKDVDIRTDIWALGVILYELLTAGPVFEAETISELIILIATQTPPPIGTKRPDVPPELEKVILCCLQKDREQRYPSVAALAHALRPFGPERAGQSVERIARILGQDPEIVATQVAMLHRPQADPVGTGTNASWGSTQGARRKRISALAVASVAACIVAIVMVAMKVRESSEAASAAAAEPSPAAVLAPVERASTPPSPSPVSPPLPSPSTSAAPVVAEREPTTPAPRPASSALSTRAPSSPAPAPRPIRPPPKKSTQAGETQSPAPRPKDLF